MKTQRQQPPHWQAIKKNITLEAQRVYALAPRAVIFGCILCIFCILHIPLQVTPMASVTYIASLLLEAVVALLLAFHVVALRPILLLAKAVALSMYRYCINHIAGHIVQGLSAALGTYTLARLPAVIGLVRALPPDNAWRRRLVPVYQCLVPQALRDQLRAWYPDSRGGADGQAAPAPAAPAGVLPRRGSLSCRW